MIETLALRPAAAELGAIAWECHRLALETGDQIFITEAEASLAMLAGLAKAGL